MRSGKNGADKSWAEYTIPSAAVGLIVLAALKYSSDCGGTKL